uniref:Uncharacterized protein n=1 Tax=Panagrolaimus sp. PS1159 TaxID=55785 RepID=A0AC35GYY9_9BILA
MVKSVFVTFFVAVIVVEILQCQGRPQKPIGPTLPPSFNGTTGGYLRIKRQSSGGTEGPISSGNGPVTMPTPTNDDETLIEMIKDLLGLGDEKSPQTRAVQTGANIF